jgi:spore coat polysaccharide biosynthesis protein SpsF (cytidylyltransferase family)
MERPRPERLMSVLAVIQARMGSTRLPGKVLADVRGEPLLELMLRRLERSRELDVIVVATSVAAEDDAIERVAEARGCRVIRGSPTDVLSRFVQASEGHDGPIVRMTGDCPLIDPAVVDATVSLFAEAPRCAYASNIEPRSFPDGLDVEVVSKQALLAADSEARDPRDREHVTTMIRREPERFPRVAVANDEDLSALRWTIDEDGDLDFLRALAERLGESLQEAGYREVLHTIRGDAALMRAGGFVRG